MSADLDLDMGDLLILLDFINRFSASPKPRAQGSSPSTPANIFGSNTGFEPFFIANFQELQFSLF